ncbi:hypothetical protein FGO68_gene7564 [Halteria grandinella]|uniref:Transmembrane protein n=1 Tax=Halteria grandinella TaxID=5974 RepID=A0A8J8NLX0_HALGN|nr:hypothetical protein FGO68_gene7564 [Halteria grandinella]
MSLFFISLSALSSAVLSNYLVQYFCDQNNCELHLYQVITVKIQRHKFEARFYYFIIKECHFLLLEYCLRIMVIQIKQIQQLHFSMAPAFLLVILYLRIQINE